MILKKLVAKNGSYTDRNGQEKVRWKTIGHLHKGEYGTYITLDPTVNLAAFPRKEGDDRVHVNLYDHEARQARNDTQQATGGGRGGDDMSDDIPFLPHAKGAEYLV